MWEFRVLFNLSRNAAEIAARISRFSLPDFVPRDLEGQIISSAKHDRVRLSDCEAELEFILRTSLRQRAAS
jgi:uncharacterized protein YpbB